MDHLLKLLELIVSWPVVVFLLLVVFGERLADLLKNLLDKLGWQVKSLKTPLGEFSFEPKNVATPLGNYNISSVAVSRQNLGPALVTGVQGTFIADRFMISWPVQGWQLHNQELERAQVPGVLDLPGLRPKALITKTEEVDGLLPNVNVLMESTGGLDFAEYVEQSDQGLRARGWDVRYASNDPQAKVAIFNYLMPPQGPDKPPTFLFNRIALDGGLAYIVTASLSQRTAETDARVAQEIAGIVNSFRLLV